jgi:putative spermidine/putrescine transport system permease protein
VTAADGAATRRLPAYLPVVPLLVLLGLAFVYPLARLAFDSVYQEGTFTLSSYGALAASPRYGLVLLRTFEVAALTTVCCLLIGYPMAYVMSRLPSRLALPLLLIVTVPFFTTTLIRSYAWIAILGSNGLLQNALEGVGYTDAPTLAFSFWGMVIGIVQVQLPLMVLPLYSVMTRIDRAQVLAAQSLGALPAKAFWYVYRPATTSGIAAGASLVFISTLGFFITPAMLGGPGDAMIAQTIQVQFGNLMDFAGASAQAVVLLAIVLLLVAALYRNIAVAMPGTTVEPSQFGEARSRWRRLRPGMPGGMTDLMERLGPVTNRAGDWIALVVSAIRKPVLGVLTAATVVYLIGPMLVVVLWGFSDKGSLMFPPDRYSLRWIGAFFESAPWVNSMLFTLGVAFVSATFAVAVGGLAAYWLVRSGARGRTLVMVACMAPVVTPVVVYALGLFYVVVPFRFNGTPIAFIVAYTVLGVPFSAFIASAALRNLDPALERAAASLGASPVRVARHVLTPLLAPALLSSFVFAFITAFDDVVVALFMSGPSAVPLPLRMWQDIVLDASPRSAAVALILFAGAALLVGLRALVVALGRVRLAVVAHNYRPVGEQA